MSKIKDIRIFKSKLPNNDRAPLPEGFSNKHLYVIIKRIVLKLRENNFSLQDSMGEYDHFYLNFSSFIDEGEILPAPRSTGTAEAFFRFFDVGISKQQMPTIEDHDKEDFVIEKLQEALIRYCAPDENTEAVIRNSIREAMEQGAEMRMLYKTKTSANRTAKLYLRFLDSGQYYPLLQVYKGEDELILEKDLATSYDLSALGDIRLTTKRVSIHPRQTAKATTFRPLSFEFEK